MKKEYYLNIAENLKKELIEKKICLEGDGRILNGGDEVIFDFKDHYVGYLTIDFSSVGHHQDAPLYFSVQFAEIREELDADTDDYRGWISKSWIQEEKIHIDVLPVSYKLERRYAFRYVKIRIINTSDNYSVIVNRISARTVSAADYSLVSYPVLPEKDRLLDKVSLKTLSSCMQEVFEDGPKRDRRLWLGDLRLEALTNYCTFRNYDLVRRCLYLFAGTDLEDGRVASNVFIYPRPEGDYQAMFDYSLFFICVLWDYYEQTGDLDTLKDLEPVCFRQYELSEEAFAGNDVIDLNRTGRVFIDWNFDLDKTASAQAVYIYVLRDLVKIEKELNRDTGRIEEEINRKTAAALKMFDTDRQLFVSGASSQVSYASQVWMILAGVCDKDTGRLILENIEKYEEAVRLNSPYAYHHYIQAMIDCGMHDEAYRKIHAYWGGMIQRGSDTFWEIYNPDDPDCSPYGGIVVHSFCHAWSCTPAYFLRKYYAGS